MYKYKVVNSRGDMRLIFVTTIKLRKIILKDLFNICNVFYYEFLYPKP